MSSQEYSKRARKNSKFSYTQHDVHTHTHLSAGKVTRKVNQPEKKEEIKKRNRHQTHDGITKKFTNLCTFLTQKSRKVYVPIWFY